MTDDWEQRWRTLISTPERGLGVIAAKTGLAALSGVYAAVVSGYRAAFDWGLLRRVVADCRVVSVGNLTVGGTGKSTTVRWLAARLRERGVPVAVVSYGYRAGSGDSVTIVSDGRRLLAPASVGGDEPRMLAEALPGVPVLIGKRRQLAAAEAVRRFGAKVCVLDDAFQYWRLVKDLDLVLIDAAEPFGGGHLLPRGMLREAPRQLRRAHAVLLTNTRRLDRSARAALREKVQTLNPSALIAEAHHAALPLRPFEGRDQCGALRTRTGSTPPDSADSPSFTLAGQRVLAVSSLGNPAGFEGMLADLGAEVISARYPDHHRYTAADWRKEAERGRTSNCAMIVTTEKDAVKIEPEWASDLPLRVLPVELAFDAGEEEIEALVNRLIEG